MLEYARILANAMGDTAVAAGSGVNAAGSAA